MKILDLGMHPFADTFIPKERLMESEPAYPLCVHLDSGGYIHLEVKTIDRYNLYDYSYTSSNSQFSREHWQNFAETLYVNGYIKSKTKIVEVGSNDGYLINQFNRYTRQAIGVDSSKAMCELANKNGVNTLNLFFNRNAALKIKKEYGKADLIVANNVLNHADDPEEFVSAVSKLLSEDGVFVFELPYWYYTISEKRFDQIYHEHQTYFTVFYSYNLLKRHGLTIVDIYEVDYHGGSIRVFAKKAKKFKKIDKVRKLIKKEVKAGLFKSSTYKKYMANLLSERNKLLQEIYKIKSKKGSIVGVGAAAKANTFLNFYNLDSSVIDYITDSSPFKIGKYTPLSRIPIVNDQVLSKYKTVYVILMSWNLNLEKFLKKINPRIIFLKK